MITTVNISHVLILAAILFGLGALGVVIRRNVLFMLISVEIMLNSAGLAFIAAGTKWVQADGQVMFLFILTMAAAEVSIGLALIMQIYHQHKTLDIDKLNNLKNEELTTRTMDNGPWSMD